MTTKTSEYQASPKSGDAMIIVDVQNDFLPGGSLAVAMLKKK